MTKSPTQKATQPIHPDSLTTIGERIKFLRRHWGWTQGDVATAVGVDKTTVCIWETGRAVPTGASSVALSALFRNSIHALIAGEGLVVTMAPTSSTNPARIRRLRSVLLPSSRKALIHSLELDRGTIWNQTASETAMRVVQALRGNKRVWIIVE